MDSEQLGKLIQKYKKFLMEYDVVETNEFPKYELVFEWPQMDVCGSWKEGKVLELRLARNLESLEPDFYSRREPWMDVSWSLDLELLPIEEDKTMSVRFEVPLHRATSHIAQAGFPVTSAESTPESSHLVNRVKEFKEKIGRRIRGERPTEHRRSLPDTLRSDPKNPLSVLLACIKWTGPADMAFSVVAAKISVENYELTAREPLAMHMNSDTSFIMESSGAMYYNNPWDRGIGPGVQLLQNWINGHGLFEFGPGEGRVCDVKMELTIQMNEASIPKIGFPFSLLSQAVHDEFQATILSLQTPTDDAVILRAFDGATYYVPCDCLTSLSGYFRAFLTGTWMHGSEVIFPQVPPFTTSMDVVNQVLYFFLRRSIFPGLLVDCMDLMVAADILEMPRLSEVAQLAVIANISVENVTSLLRFAWDYHCDFLFRAAALFWKSNYDEIWVDNKHECAELGILFSTPKFLDAFLMKSESRPGIER